MLCQGNRFLFSHSLAVVGIEEAHDVDAARSACNNALTENHASERHHVHLKFSFKFKIVQKLNSKAHLSAFDFVIASNDETGRQLLAVVVNNRFSQVRSGLDLWRLTS